MDSYEELLDKMEERNKLLSVQLKQLRQEAKEWRTIANGFAHHHALSRDKHPVFWIKEIYDNWEKKNRLWWGV